jgi:hypothetical protein
LILLSLETGRPSSFEMIGKGLEVFFLIDLFHLRTTSVPVPSPSKDCNSCSDTSVIGM